jgi:CBS-domain-containing membrane protein
LTASRVADIYTKDCLTVGVDAPAAEIAALMVKEKKYLLPVLDDHGRLVGIVSRADLLTLIS